MCIEIIISTIIRITISANSDGTVDTEMYIVRRFFSRFNQIVKKGTRLTKNPQWYPGSNFGHDNGLSCICREAKKYYFTEKS